MEVLVTCGPTNLKGKEVISIASKFLLQESERGYWHVPIATESTDEHLRSWLCITRPRSCSSASCSSMKSQHALHNRSNGDKASHQNFENGVVSLTGKRKERDPSPSAQQ